MITTPLNLLDGCFLNIDRAEAPWGIHLELQLERQVNPEKLADAIRHAMQVHPLARARIAPYSATATRYAWEIADDVDALPFSALKVRSNADLEVERNRMLSEQVPTDRAPVFDIVLAQCRDGDRILIHLNHTLADGLSTFRLLNSIVRHYAGEADPVPEFDPLSVRDLKKLAGSQSIAKRLERIKLLLEHLASSTREPVRIRSQGGGGSGYGCVLLPLSADETRAFVSRREKPATVNDMLLAAMFLTILRWNRERDRSPGRVTAIMPVNLRPQDWWFEVVGNFSSYVSVQLLPGQQDHFRQAVQAVTEQTQRLKQAGAAGVLIDVLDVPKFLPAMLKARLRDVTPTLGRNLVESTWVSNLGQLDGLPAMGDAGKIRGLYFSPPAPMPMGVSAGIASFQGQLFIGLRYSRAKFNHEAARQFADLLRRTLAGQ